MFYFPFALLLCADRRRTDAAVRALTAATNVVHVNCALNPKPNLEWLDSLPKQNRPLLVISGAHTPRLRDRIASHLESSAIDFTTVGISRVPTIDFGDEFPLNDHELLGLIHTPRARPRLTPPTLLTHALRTADRLVPPPGVQIEIPLHTMSFIVPSGLREPEDDDEFDEVWSLGSVYCDLFNRDLPTSCPQCGADLNPGRECPDCGAASEAAPLALVSAEDGCVASRADAPDQIVARFAGVGD